MHFDSGGIGNNSTRDRTLIKLLKPTAIIAAGISKVVFLYSDSDKLSNRLNLLLQEKHAGNTSDLNNKKVFAILDKLLKNKCLSKKQHKQILNKCNLLHE